MFVWDMAGETYLHSLGLTPKNGLREDLSVLSLHQSACYLQREYSLSLSAEEIMSGINQTVEDFYIYDVLPKPGVTAFLERTKQEGIPMCIATASDRYQVEAALRRCNMAHFFDAIFTCTEVGHGKDHPSIFRQATTHFGADRSNSLVFEDALHAIQTAKADGFTVAAVFDPSEKQQEKIKSLADYYFYDFEYTEAFWRMLYEDENSVVHCRQ